MTKKICKIILAIVSSIAFGMLNFSALSYGSLYVEKSGFPPVPIVSSQLLESSKNQSSQNSTQPCKSRKEEKQVAYTTNSTLYSPPVSITNCAN